MRIPQSKPFIPSPVKKRDPRKTKVTVAIKTNEVKLKKLHAELLKLTEQRARRSEPQIISELGTDLCEIVDTSEDWMDVEIGQEPASTQLETQPTVDTNTKVVVCHPPTC